MCCGCRRIQFLISNTAYVIERLVQCFALTAVVFCIGGTILFVLAIGIGLGYNYCFVDLKTLNLTDVPLEPSSGRRSNGLLPLNVSNQEQLRVAPVVQDTTEPEPIFLKSTMVVSLDDNQYISRLLPMIRAMHKNVTLEFVAT